MKVVYCTLFPLVSFYLKFSHIRFLMRQYVQIHLGYAMYSFLHRTIFSHWIFWVEFLMRHAFRGIRPRGSVMKRVRVGHERASTETWAPSRTLTPQVHIYIYMRGEERVLYGSIIQKIMRRELHPISVYCLLLCSCDCFSSSATRRYSESLVSQQENLSLIPCPYAKIKWKSFTPSIFNPRCK